MAAFRKILFFLFVLIYLTVCPLLIMYSLGIIFKPATQSLERTGVIYVSTVPSEAKVFINRRYFKDSTPALIAGLLPGQYHLRVVKAGYKDWHKVLPVLEQRSTSVESILLIPKAWPQQKLGGSYDQLIRLEGSPFLLLRNGSKLKDLNILQEVPPESSADTADRPVPVVAPEDPLGEAPLLEIITAMQSPVILARIKEDRLRYLSIELNEEDPKVTDMGNLIPADAKAIRWSAHHPQVLYYLNDGTLHAADTEAQTVTPLYSGVKNYVLNGDHLIVLTRENFLKRLNREGKDEETILNDPILVRKLFEPYKEIGMELYDDRLMVFLTEKGSLLLNQLPHVLVEDGIRGFEYRLEDRRLLFWDRRDIGVIETNAASEEDFFELGPQITWLNLRQNDIEQAFFINDGHHVLFRNDETVYVTEVNSFGQPAADEITRVKKNTDVALNEDRTVLYYLEPKTGALAAITLGARSFSLPLPAAN